VVLRHARADEAEAIRSLCEGKICLFEGMKLVPVILLVLGSPVIAELLSGNMSLDVFFSPLYFIFLTALYGSGALLLRELKVRWNKGTACLLLLGLAYGVIEEGIIFSIFFVEGKQLTVVYHAIFSITIPVLLVEMLAEHLSIEENERWLDNLGFGVCATIFIGTVIIGIMFRVIEIGEPKPFFQYAVSIILASILILIAHVLPSGIADNGKLIGNTVYFFIIGLIWSAIFFILPDLINSTILSMLIQFLWIGFLAFFLSHYDLNDDAHRLSLIAGLLIFFVVPFFIHNFLY